MMNKLRTETSGILVWMVQGWLAYQWAGGLHPPSEVQQATQEYRQESDTIAQFLDEYYHTDTDAKVNASTLYRQYVAWAERSGQEAGSQKKFGTYVGKLYSRKRVREEGQLAWAYIGLAEGPKTDGE